MTISRFITFLSIILLSTQVIAATKSITIANKGIAKAVIVLDSNATQTEQFAAQELKNHLEQITSGSFKIVNPAYKTKQTRIIIGQCNEVHKLLPKIKFDNLKPDSIIIAAINNKLILAGNRPRGTIYAVYTFLEDYLGCEWWDQNNSYIPKKKTIILMNPIYKVYASPFNYRSIWYHYMEYEKGPFGARLKLNGEIPQPLPKYGGHITTIVPGHSLHYILPPDIYFVSHPEWYGLYNNKRYAILPSGHKNQLCLSNMEMRQEFANRVLQLIKTNPDAEIISVCQQDGSRPCSCDLCKDMDIRYGGQSGTLLAFVNQIADKVKAVYPKITVQTFAYQWSINPPTVAASGALARRDNVNVRIAPINEDFGAPWNSKRNNRVSSLIKKWKNYANLSIYDYAMNYHQPLILLPNWNTFSANINYYAQNKVNSIIYQGDISNDGANFCRLKAWLIAHLMWDPSNNQDALTKRFLNGYYGKAGPYLKKYIDLTSKASLRNVSFMPIWSDDPCFLTNTQLQNAKSYFDKAEYAVRNNSELLTRVKIERLGFDHQLLLCRLAIPEVKSWISEAYRDKFAKDFIALAKSSGNYFISEAAPMPDNYYNILTGRTEVDISKNILPNTKKSVSMPVIVARLNLKSKDWSDIQENQFLLTPSNREIISDSTASNGIGIKMPGGVYDWILQTPVFSRNCISSNVDLYVTAKINTTLTTGIAFKIVVYDLPAGTFPLERWVDISEFNKNSGFQEIKIGTITPSERQVIICVPSSVANVTNFIIDRIFFIKKNQN